MKLKHWEMIEESKPSTQLDPGAYVCRIVDVNDVPEKEYLWIVYDVAEGQQSGCYANMGRDEAWKHRFTRSYKETAEGMFKAFLNRLEESNRGRFSVSAWSQTCDERQLVGLEVGLLFQKEQYTNDKGDDKERTVVVGVVASQDVRNGDYKLPEPKDRRTKVESPSVPDYDANIPF